MRIGFLEGVHCSRSWSVCSDGIHEKAPGLIPHFEAPAIRATVDNVRMSGATCNVNIQFEVTKLSFCGLGEAFSERHQN